MLMLNVEIRAVCTESISRTLQTEGNPLLWKATGSPSRYASFTQTSQPVKLFPQNLVWPACSTGHFNPVAAPDVKKQIAVPH